MYSYLSTNDVETNLIDIGCTQEQIKDFMHYFQEKKRKEMYQFLKLHRCKLLKTVHQEQKKKDYLDYLVYMLKKEESENEC